MREPSLQVNPNASLSVRRVGQEQTPLIMIDDFAQDTSGVIDFACTGAAYGDDATSAYPGIRAKLPRSYVVPLLNSIFRLLYQVYSVPADLKLKPVNTVYSLIATPEDELSVAQCVPHFDSNTNWYLAVLHYLNPGDFCSTGLFRHRPSGFEKITTERLGEFLASSRAYTEEHGPPPQRYISGSAGQFELYEEIAYKPNRLVVYPGNLLHSGLVDPAVDINPDPRTGRLTANVFVDFRA